MTTDCNPFDTVVGLLGGGQLGRMLLQAASPLSIPILVLDPAVASPAKQVFAPSLHALSSAQAPLRHLDGQFTDAASIRELAAQVDVITIEIEHVDVTALEAVEQEFAAAGGRSGKGVKVYPASRVVRIIQDKFLQKEHLAARGIAVAPFRQITCDGDDTLDVQALVPSILAAGEAFGYPLMLKSRHLAYDGKGNYVLPSSSPSDIAAALAALVPTASLPTAAKPGHPLRNRLYAEKFAAFSMEVAVMVVRGVSGETRAYEPVETVHRENVCHIVYSPLRPRRGANEGVGNAQRGDGGATDVAARARSMAEAAISALGDGAVGVFGVEMFLMKDGALLLNEIAPRPHNSGHHTIESCTPSQYTSHLYAVLSLPLPPITVLVPACAMLNLLGASSSIEDDFLRADGVARKAISLGASVHLYGKEGSRKGRKMGHVTVVGSSDDEVRDKIEQLVATLPPMYRHPVPTLPTPGRPGFSHAYPLVSVIMGSDSDLPVMLPATAILTAFNIPYELSIVSAHRTPARMVQFARTAESRGVRVVIAGAGGAAHLPGMVASETTLPVIGVPVRGSTALDGVDSLYSIVQMPRGIPVATVAINNSTNAALLAVRILSGSLPRLTKELAQYAEKLEEEVMGKIQKLEEVGWDMYGKK